MSDQLPGQLAFVHLQGRGAVQGGTQDRQQNTSYLEPGTGTTGTVTEDGGAVHCTYRAALSTTSRTHRILSLGQRQQGRLQRMAERCTV